MTQKKKETIGKGERWTKEKRRDDYGKHYHVYTKPVAHYPTAKICLAVTGSGNPPGGTGIAPAVVTQWGKLEGLPVDQYPNQDWFTIGGRSQVKVMEDFEGGHLPDWFMVRYWESLAMRMYWEKKGK